MNTDFRSINQPFSNTVIVDGKTYLYFGGTAYLGIPQNEAFIHLYLEGIKKFGLNNGTSRSNNIQLGIYDAAEQEAATRFLANDALITSSGYLAAQLTVKSLSAFGKVIYAPATHPALWLNGQPDTFSNSFSQWKHHTIETINSSQEQNYVLISNSMNNLFPEVYDFDFLEEIKPDKNIVLIVDDSHGIGVNNNGLGAFSELPKLKNVETVVVASMAKALGIDAGLVLADKAVIAQLKNTNIFVGASPPTAAGLFAFIHAAEIYNTAWVKLQQNISHLKQNLSSSWHGAPNFPAFLTKQENIAQKLSSYQMLISSFPYPTKDSPPINRIVLSSWHTTADLDLFIDCLAKIKGIDHSDEEV
ncbi:aminotransferase class I/II-fold pyridoxal phosphate-dependent enzyme [Pedobacter sandarakinus]|uniref:aminotransferase class I/II-fold pyridoxal phosphate-dependent enzyme n=1 Tax=Pedobacter sandarakinus TaxID=353156 RepID=UPI002246561F|nr:aminotransferase class I/II-fold pyridoxal phosphate-dependent enzyme [Pedobacter sandarakinus]MCX2573800.1 aminotransferase class I/II-fold pyridoxal phosphate-dependent enzyme [Pedobacter sandarakinus]